jgi:arsenate reductase
MKKVYYLKSCNTCLRIINALNLSTEFELQDIKSSPITETQLETMKLLSGSYESLFSKRAQLYKKLDLKHKDLSEEDFKSYILQHYTFLKRPVFIIEDAIFIGNSKKTVEAIGAALEG